MDCATCKDPTKRPVGFWAAADANGKATQGYLFDCDSETCPEAQTRRAAAAAKTENHETVRKINAENGMDAREYRRLRIEARCTIMDISRILQCGPAQYSAYETEREPIPIWARSLLTPYLRGE